MTDTHALAFKDRHGEWWFIPTVPEARKWRGPYRNETLLERACCGELGSDVTITRITVNGPNL